MKGFKMLRLSVVILPLFLVMCITCCASAPPLTALNENLLNIGPQDGIIVGSVKIKTEDYKGRKLFKYKIKNKTCVLTLFKHDRKGEKIQNSPHKYQISATADGEEVPFVAILPAGRYTFRGVTIKVFNDHQWGHMLASFNVIPEKSTYIGTLDITLPEYGRYGIGVDLKIKDAQEVTVSKLKNVYANLNENISKNLMVLGE